MNKVIAYAKYLINSRFAVTIKKGIPLSFD